MSVEKKEIAVRQKTENGELDFGRDYTRWLDGDTINVSTWVVPAGLNTVTATNDNTSAVVFVSGGALGERYRLINRISTVGGRTEEFALDVDIVKYKS